MKWKLIRVLGWSLVVIIATAGISHNASARNNTEGFIYGKVVTKSGNTYTGLLRWGSEEAFWDDLFNSSKDDSPYAGYAENNEEDTDIGKIEKVDELDKIIDNMKDLEIKVKKRKLENEDKTEITIELEDIQDQLRELKREARRLQREVEMESKQSNNTWTSILGGAITLDLRSLWSSRQFIARFGDISKIKVIGSEDAEITMKNGSVFTVSGYANDVGNAIQVSDTDLGGIEVDWNKIKTIEFMPTPKSVKPKGFRLRGTVSSDAGDYTGFIQWDSEECLSYDKLDGDSEDGRISIEMGRIKSIERRSRNSSRVTLKDGREFILDGTNDVNSSIRGIMVEDPRYGRVKVPWDSFEKAEFEPAGGSGPGYNSYTTPVKLKGTVTTSDDETHSGRIVFDLDEAESWEMLNGNYFSVEYNITFDRIASISPRNSGSSMVILRNGERLRLDDSQDVTDSNDGVLIFAGDDDKDYVYIEWDEVDRIDFKW